MSEIFAQTNLVVAMKVWEGWGGGLHFRAEQWAHGGLITGSSALLHIVKFSTIKREGMRSICLWFSNTGHSFCNSSATPHAAEVCALLKSH